MMTDSWSLLVCQMMCENVSTASALVALSVSHTTHPLQHANTTKYHQSTALKTSAVHLWIKLLVPYQSRIPQLKQYDNNRLENK